MRSFKINLKASKHALYASTLTLLFFVVSASPALAFDYPNPIGCDSFSACIVLLINIAWKIAIPITVIIIVYGGFLFVTAGGDTTKVKAARDTLTWAAVGVVVIIAAYALATAFQGFFANLGH